MPKVKRKNEGGAQSSPYAKPAAAKAGHTIFKMDKDLGQHVLKNPGVASAIVQKANRTPRATLRWTKY
jgi:18S rRNA (adenine1779-N6/adenine1780-N6)-dimethyltransferase